MNIKIIHDHQIQIENHFFPMVGFGTYPLQGEVCEKSIRTAFEVGYRCFDTATMYKNFDAIGKSLKNLNRSDIFITSKVWPDSQEGAKLKADLEGTLKSLKVDYLDAYLLHWPNSQINLNEIIDNLNDLIERKMVRYVGLSNITIHHLKKALIKGMPVSFVQNEMNPIFFDNELLKFCHDQNILMQAWAPLSRGRINQCDYILSLSEKYHKTPAQIALKWIVQLQCLPLPGSSNAHYIQENFDIFDFKLTDSDMALITNKAIKGKRERVTQERGLGFADEFDYSYEQCWPMS